MVYIFVVHFRAFFSFSITVLKSQNTEKKSHNSSLYLDNHSSVTGGQTQQFQQTRGCCRPDVLTVQEKILNPRILEHGHNASCVVSRSFLLFLNLGLGTT